MRRKSAYHTYWRVRHPFRAAVEPRRVRRVRRRAWQVRHPLRAGAWALFRGR
jgi:hypothetical protein